MWCHRDGIRVNIVNPHGVFATGMWSEKLIAERAAQYNLDLESYKRRNLLGTEVTPGHVTEVVAELVG